LEVWLSYSLDGKGIGAGLSEGARDISFSTSSRSNLDALILLSIGQREPFSLR